METSPTFQKRLICVPVRRAPSHLGTKLTSQVTEPGSSQGTTLLSYREESSCERWAAAKDGLREANSAKLAMRAEANTAPLQKRLVSGLRLCKALPHMFATKCQVEMSMSKSCNLHLVLEVCSGSSCGMRRRLSRPAQVSVPWIVVADLPVAAIAGWCKDPSSADEMHKLRGRPHKELGSRARLCKGPCKC